MAYDKNSSTYQELTIFRFIVLVLRTVNVFVSATNRENVALFKDANESSHYYRGRLASGNDGVLIQNFNQYECTHSEIDQDKYWWAVDLGKQYTIDSITIYNRKDGLGHKLYDFYAYLFNPTIPTWDTFDAAEPMLCYFHGGQSPDILNFSCNKKTFGRYLQIYKNYRYLADGDTLTLCEVQAYTNHQERASTFCKEINKRPIQHIYNLLTISRIECALNCFIYDNCIGFVITEETRCDLYQTSMTVDTADNDLNYYEKC